MLKGERIEDELVNSVKKYISCHKSENHQHNEDCRKPPIWAIVRTISTGLNLDKSLPPFFIGSLDTVSMYFYSNPSAQADFDKFTKSLFEEEEQ